MSHSVLSTGRRRCFKFCVEENFTNRFMFAKKSSAETLYCRVGRENQYSNLNISTDLRQQIGKFEVNTCRGHHPHSLRPQAHTHSQVHVAHTCSLFPRPHLSQGNGSDELGKNPWTAFNSPIRSLFCNSRMTSLPYSQLYKMNRPIRSKFCSSLNHPRNHADQSELWLCWCAP